MSIFAPPRLHVMHVPSVDPERTRCVDYLAEQTDVCVHPDPQRKGAMWNWATAMECIALEAQASDWHFVVQDDMRPYRGWMQHLERACTNSPAPMLGLCWIGDRWGDGARKGYPYMTGPNLIRGGAVAYHRACFPDLARFARAVSEHTTYPHDDMAACVWAQEVRGFEPALVSHTLFESLPTRSLVGHARQPTGTFTIEDPAPIDWARAPRSTRVTHHASTFGAGLMHEVMRYADAHNPA
jgi:hypothetical protein